MVKIGNHSLQCALLSGPFNITYKLKIKIMITRFFLISLLFLTGTAAASTEWSLARDRDGIKVWTRDIPGYPIRAFKAVMVVQSSLAGLVNLVMDTDNASHWVYRTDRIELLKRDEANASFVIRAETDFPWPLNDRDVIVAGRLEQDEKTGTVVIQSHSTPEGAYPVDPKFVRMPDMEGTWIFRPLGAEKIEVTMMGRADPGGNIPAGIVNLIIHETPYRTLQGMRRMLPNVRYQKAPLPQIREPGK